MFISIEIIDTVTKEKIKATMKRNGNTTIKKASAGMIEMCREMDTTTSIGEIRETKIPIDEIGIVPKKTKSARKGELDTLLDLNISFKRLFHNIALANPKRKKAKVNGEKMYLDEVAVVKKKRMLGRN